MFYILVGVMIVCFLFSSYMIYRNHVVYSYYMFVLKESSNDRVRNYSKLPPYNVAIWQLTTFNWDHCWKDSE